VSATLMMLKLPNCRNIKMQSFSFIEDLLPESAPLLSDWRSNHLPKRGRLCYSPALTGRAFPVILAIEIWTSMPLVSSISSSYSNCSGGAIFSQDGLLYDIATKAPALPPILPINTTSTAQYLQSLLLISFRKAQKEYKGISYAALAAKISCLLALVNRLITVLNNSVNTSKRPMHTAFS
jgi:hypothetical protein